MMTTSIASVGDMAPLYLAATLASAPTPTLTEFPAHDAPQLAVNVVWAIYPLP